MKPHRTFVRRGVNPFALTLLAALLVLPGFAAHRVALTVGAVEVGGYFLLISVLTYWFYADDKRRAAAGEQRTPESFLHLAEWLGGWPTAFLAQRLLRHKIVKVRYQVVFWMIVIMHEATAFDFLQDWQYSRNVLSRLFVYQADTRKSDCLEIRFTREPFAVAFCNSDRRTF